MKNTLDLLRLTGKIIETWSDGEVSEIEKDTVLENLRKIYGEIKYAGEVPAVQITEDIPVVVPVAAAAEPQPVTELVHAVAPGPEPVEVTIDLTEIPGVIEPGGSVEEPSCIVNSEDEAAETAENILFPEAEIPVKPKLDKKVILSLYGDDPAPVVQKERQAEPALAPETAAQPAVTQNIADAAEPVQVLGDVLNNDTQTVADVYSGQAPKADVASVIGSGKVEGIRKAIGINDKFLIIRNLFDGNASDYDTVMSILDDFGDLDEALIYIHENFDWKPDNEAVKLIIDLLTRKLS